MFLIHKVSPLQQIRTEALAAKSVQLYLKRDDLLHPHISGNKWRKLKYNIAQAQQQSATALLTFGGAFSNHIAATAAAGQAAGYATIGIIRGEAHLPLNPTLRFATDCGMQLQYISRSDYRQKDTAVFRTQLQRQHPNAYIIPEGGTNIHALKGCAEIITEITAQRQEQLADYYCVACGTGGTIAGMIQGLEGRKNIIGCAVLKGDFIRDEVSQLLEQSNSPTTPDNWHIHNDFHHGGYARFTPALIDFINQFKQEHQIALDPIYTGKLLFAIFELVERDYFPKGSSIVAVHTGGLQGIAGFNQRFGQLLV